MRPAGHIAHRENVRGADRGEVRVTYHAIVDNQSRPVEPLIVRNGSDADDHRLGPQHRRVAQPDGEVTGPPADRLHSDPEARPDPVATMHVGQERTDHGTHRAFHRDRHRVHQGHVAAGRSRGRGPLGTDETGPDHHHRAAVGEALPQGQAVRQRPQLVHARGRPPRGRPCRRARRDHEVVIGQRLAVRQPHQPGLRVQRPSRCSQPQFDPGVRRGLRGEQARALRGPGAGQHLLGQRRPVVGQFGLLPHQGDAALIPLGAQSPGGADAADGRAHDDDPVWHGNSFAASPDVAAITSKKQVTGGQALTNPEPPPSVWHTKLYA